MFAETAQRIKQDLLNEGIQQGELSEKHEVLIRLVDLKFGLAEDEKVRIRDIQSPGLLDSALDAFATGDDKFGVLVKLNQD